jgi:hypothetical protein
MAGGGYTGGSTIIRIGPNGTLWPTRDGSDMGWPRNAKAKAKARKEVRKRQKPARKRGRGNNAAGKRAGSGAATTRVKATKGVSIHRESERVAEEFEATLEAALLAANKRPEG